MQADTFPCAEMTLARDGVKWREIEPIHTEYNFLENNASNNDDGAAARLLDARLARGISTETFARALGVALVEAQEWERGQRCPEFWLKKASELLRVDYQWLATGRADDSRSDARATSNDERRAARKIMRKLKAFVER